MICANFTAEAEPLWWFPSVQEHRFTIEHHKYHVKIGSTVCSLRKCIARWLEIEIFLLILKYATKRILCKFALTPCRRNLLGK
jgi:hypothetical protein